MSKPQKNLIKKNSSDYQNLSSKGTIKLQKSKIKALSNEVSSYEKDNSKLLLSSSKLFDNVSQMTYDDVKTLAEYVRSNNQKIEQTHTKINSILDAKSKITEKIKAINNVSE